MTKFEQLSGVVVAFDTPFDEEGAVSPDRVRRNAHFVVESGVSGFFACGGTGLGAVLTLEERETVIEALLDEMAGDVPVLVHAGSPITRDCIRIAQHAGENGATAVVLSSPDGYYRHEPEAVHEHFGLICEGLGDLPFFLYRRPTDAWGTQLVQALKSAHPNLVGIKDSATDINLHLQFLETQLDVFQGYEPLATASILAGDKGLISGLATIFPEHVVRLYQSLVSGDLDAARAQQAFVNKLVMTTYKPAPYRRFKAVLRARGYPSGEVRRPFRPITAKEESELLERLARLGALDQRAEGVQ